MTFGGVRTDADAESLISASDGLITPIRCDVTDADQIAAAADQVLSVTGGSLTGLVNNAGIARPGPLEILRSRTCASNSTSTWWGSSQ